MNGLRLRLRLLAAAAALSAATAAGPARAQDAAGDAVAGRQKAAACAACHGPLGIAVAPDAPNLAGQSPIYLSAQLKAYRNGARVHEIMSLMAKPLGDADIANLAAWYSSVKVTAAQPGP